MHVSLIFFGFTHTVLGVRGDIMQQAKSKEACARRFSCLKRACEYSVELENSEKIRFFGEFRFDITENEPYQVKCFVV